MIEYGRSARWYNNYAAEIEFCKRHGFSFMQIWYKDGALQFDRLTDPAKTIKEAGFPIIIHALFDLEDYEKHGQDLLRVLTFLSHKEVIIHPICHTSPITPDTNGRLAELNQKLTETFFKEGITVYIENNSRLDPVNHTPPEVAAVLENSPKTELCLDLAHINDYAHLRELVGVKFPTCLHVADKHFGAVHEHSPVGQGDLDFRYIFSEYLKGFDGKMIFEVVSDNDDDIVDSKTAIHSILDGSDCI